MEKLGQLHREAVENGEWDLVIVDTPPSRSALDFLDAPATARRRSSTVGSSASCWHRPAPAARPT